jgi:hypothetical protein
VFRPKHAVLLGTAVTAMALGGAGVALAASGGGSSSGSSGAGTTATTTTQSSSHHCDHDNSGT